MNAIERQFGVPRVLLPVVHPVQVASAQKSIDTAVEAGVPGVFLINQGTTPEGVSKLAAWARKQHPSLWVGVNILGSSPESALDYALDGLWTDNAFIDERFGSDQSLPEAFRQERLRRGWDGLYFGGVAFKYQGYFTDIEAANAATIATKYMDVVTTSGPGTGQAISLSKLRSMSEALRENDDFALGLASGVNLENVGDFLPHVHAYLVGTSLETSLGVLDLDRVRKLHERIQGS